MSADTPSLDTVLHIIQLAVFGGGGVALYTRTVRFFTLWESRFKEYPPHLHVNGNIKYPSGMHPEKMDTLPLKDKT